MGSCDPDMGLLACQISVMQMALRAKAAGGASLVSDSVDQVCNRVIWHVHQ